MNLAQLYAATLSQKITKPYLNPIFFPLPFNKYIVVQGFTKDSKNYSYWVEIIEFIKPELDKLEIKLVSVGAKPEENLPGCYATAGQTSFPQLEYIIQNSRGYIGADSISAHIAGSFDVPRIVLVSNNYANCVEPYFGLREKQIILEPERKKDEKPSFSLSENPKSINTIRPETILAAIRSLFDITTPSITSLHFGEAYTQPAIEYVPNFPLNPQAAPGQVLHMRLDFLKEDFSTQNYQFILQVLSQRKGIIYTEKPINLELLKQVRQNIALLVYKLPPEDDIEFVKSIKKAGIQFRVIKEYRQIPAKSKINTENNPADSGKIGQKLSRHITPDYATKTENAPEQVSLESTVSPDDENYLNSESIANLKFKYLDVTPIQFVEKKKVELEYQDGLRYRTNRIIFSNQQRFISKMAFEKKLNNDTNTAIINSEEEFTELLKEQEYLYIYGQTT